VRAAGSGPGPGRLGSQAGPSMQAAVVGEAPVVWRRELVGAVMATTTTVVGRRGQGLPRWRAVVRAVLRGMLRGGGRHLHGRGRPATVAGGIVREGVGEGRARVRPVLRLVRRWVLLLLLLLLLLLKLLRQLKNQVGGAGILQQLLQLRQLLRVGQALLRRLRRRRRRRCRRIRGRRRRAGWWGEGRGRSGHLHRRADGSPAAAGWPRTASRGVEDSRYVGVVWGRDGHRLNHDWLGLRGRHDSGGRYLDGDEGRIVHLPPPAPTPTPSTPRPPKRMQVAKKS
jgi:hypothetical protein